VIDARTRRKSGEVPTKSAVNQGPLVICASRVTSALTAEWETQAAHRGNVLRDFSDFTPDDEPYGEHDFGAFDLDGVRLFWKIDVTTWRSSTARRTRAMRRRGGASSPSCWLRNNSSTKPTRPRLLPGRDDRLPTIPRQPPKIAGEICLE